MVETEYIGKRRDFKNSYFVSFRQILNGFGRCTFTIELNAVEAVAILISLILGLIILSATCRFGSAVKGLLLLTLTLSW
jgi:hypothetical protein